MASALHRESCNLAEPFKNLINRALVAGSAKHLQRVWPAFDSARFVSLSVHGLEQLELKARAMQVADALEATLPDDFEAAAGILEAALAPPDAGTDLTGHPSADDGVRGWILWSVGEYVARRGLHEPQRALQALHAITQRFTAEFAIRPIIVAHPSLAFATLARWTGDPSPHVRRLVSEGSRPRLPWGLQLKSLIADPSPTLPLLRALQDDPSEYVRRSVANHLNDIAKDHPAIVAEWLEQHLPSASVQRRALLRHASRTLIKRGDRRVLAAWGLGHAFEGEATLTITPRRVNVGDVFTLALTLRSTAESHQQLEVDYAIHHRKRDGRTSAKVFKGWRVTLPAGGSLQLTKRHSMQVVTTRRYHPGRHVVDVNINGVTCATGHFSLSPPRIPSR